MVSKENNRKYNITYTFAKHEIRSEIAKMNNMVENKKLFFEKGQNFMGRSFRNTKYAHANGSLNHQS